MSATLASRRPSSPVDPQLGFLCVHCLAPHARRCWWCGWPACEMHLLSPDPCGCGCSSCGGPHAKREPVAVLAPSETLTERSPKPFVFTRDYALARILANWDEGEIDDRQCERLCAGVHAGDFDEFALWARALTSARRRHKRRGHLESFEYDPRLFHRSGLSRAVLGKNAAELRMLLWTMSDPLTNWRIHHDWERRQWGLRYALLDRRYTWLTGAHWGDAS